MIRETRSPIKFAAVVVLVVAAASAGAYYVWHARTTVADKAPKGYSAEALNKLSSDPDQLRKQMRDLRDREDLTEDQRRAAFENMRGVFEKIMDDHAAEYASAKTEADKNAVLDKHIAEMQKQAAEWEKERAEWEKRREQERTASGGDKGNGSAGGGAQGSGSGSGQGQGQAGGQGQARGPDGRGGRGGRDMTTAERKARSEARDPDKTARRMAYFGALHKRAEEKGVKLPFPGMGGRGPGGPRGGGRPG